MLYSAVQRTMTILEYMYSSCITSRARPFRLLTFLLISEIKRTWIRFTCISLFHNKISLLFFVCFLLKFFASLRFSNFCFEMKRSKIQVYFFVFFRFFRFYSLFCFFCFFSLFFASKRNEGENFFASKEAKFNIFHIMLLPSWGATLDTLDTR